MKSWMMLIALFAGLAGVTARAGRIPVLVDTDMAPDDWSAILYLLHRPEVRVAGIAVDGTGEAHCDRASGNLAGAWNALGLVELAGRASDQISVACGPTTPMRGSHRFPDLWRANSDEIFGLRLPRGVRSPDSRDAVELIVSVLEGAENKVRILALGPLTNLGIVLERRPDLAKKIDVIVVMGGAVRVPGNLKDPGSTLRDNEVAEWNIYVDPHAAAVVLGSGAPVELVSLDGTNHAPVTLGFLKRLGESARTPSARFIHAYLSKEIDFIKTGMFYFWDPLAATVVTDPFVCRFDDASLAVTEEEGPESGRTRLDPLGHRVRVCTRADGPRFEKLFLGTVNSASPAL